MRESVKNNREREQAMHIEKSREKRNLVGWDLERKEEVVGLGMGTTQVGEIVHQGKRRIEEQTELQERGFE